MGCQKLVVFLLMLAGSWAVAAEDNVEKRQELNRKGQKAAEEYKLGEAQRLFTAAFIEGLKTPDTTLVETVIGLADVSARGGGPVPKGHFKGLFPFLEKRGDGQSELAGRAHLAYARALSRADETKAAEDEFAKAIETLRAAHPSGHLLRVEAYDHFAFHMWLDRQRANAADLYTLGIEMAEQLKPLPVDRLLHMLQYRGDVFAELGAFADSESDCRRYLELAKAHNSPRTRSQDTLTRAGRACIGQGKFSEAEDFFRQGDAIAAGNIKDPDDPGRLFYGVRIAEALRLQQKFSETEKLLRETLAGSKRKPDEYDYTPVDTLFALALIMEIQGSQQEADKNLYGAAFLARKMDFRETKTEEIVSDASRTLKLARELNEKNDHFAAAAVCRLTLQRQLTLLPFSKHPQIKEVCDVLADALNKTGHRPESEAIRRWGQRYGVQQ